MRLRLSADRHEVRQQYLPLFFIKVVRCLIKDGKEVVPEVIDTMDSYYLTREDFDALTELEIVSSSSDSYKIDAQTKSFFTRTYVN